ncbi:LexA family protein [Pedobacter rhizosphaerae]|uniref:SOS response UmuD protein. Serine peptidase. MEROPS family S24 n=1 Tax=Pedobacter rhizosphaerae TaxID=390241 RepID=A0A1H9P4A2_9SPHI|nr:S24 family peptidase [Pedobacter rhizosphaerae]SER43046.1 SOS response UmuD protein. Serine peptidase. MEROPS family S24 [Pedobacter rhizosphaerae]
MIREIEIQKNNVLDTLDDPSRVSGFISPAEDYKQRRLHIAQKIVNDPTNTFYFEADDDHMRYFGIMKGSIIIVDKSIKVTSGMLIVCCVDDEWLTRKLLISGDNTYLCINDGLDACMNITGKNISVFGAVTWTCLPHSKRNNVRTGRL